MKNGIAVFLVVVFFTGLLLASGAFFEVDETQQVVLTQFGELVGQPITKAGLYFKMPFIQKANYFDKRILEWDGDPDQIPTIEKRLIWVDMTARWRIIDVLTFMKTMGTEQNAQSRLDDILDAKSRDVIPSHKLIEVIRNSNRLLEGGARSSLESSTDELTETALESIKEGREVLSRKVFELASASIREFGIELVDVKIKRINYVEEVRNKVYERMISERKRAAEKFRSEGQGKRAEVEGQMAKELEQINAEAYKKSQEIKGKADALAIKIYADAYNNDPEFYSFVKTLESYKKTAGQQTTMILSTQNEFFKFFNSVDGSRALIK
ncbi:MAG TPA: protease modulator HflC [Candidatus Omnitrophica bacterium]|nr:MAG: HflC protein [Omnitrophica WOR_2 bacterium GWA2_45_18]HBR13949.1 protease modulator HflC [Candidatus Omnitrophota bacterium]